MDLALLSQGALVLAADKSGVGPKAISLPSGPGSIEGLGESFEPTLNTGTAKYGLGFAVPPGPAGRSPGVGLAYEGGRGNGPVGFGWGLDVPYLQRQTDKGIPRYVDVANGIDDDLDGLFDEADELDTIVNSGGEELVPTGQYYFCENESAFVRYERIPGSCSVTTVQTCVADTECPVGETCAGMHWEGTLPDGTLQEYGLTPEGQVTDETGHRVFRWLLQRSTDTNGNTTIYRYRAFDEITELDPSRRERNLNQKYLSSIEYGPGAPPWAHHHFLLFEYEDRSDWFEDARSSFLVRTGVRLKRAVVGTRSADLDLAAKGHALVDFNQDGAVDSGAFLNRRYELVYGGDPHWSLLTSVTLVGADGVSTLPPMVLDYTTAPIPAEISAMAGRCSVTEQSCSSDPQCPGGEVCVLGTLGAANAPPKVMDDPYVDLIDMNADGLPDILRTDGLTHTAYLNRGQVGSDLVWSDGIEVGGDERAWNFNLQSTSGALVQLTDQDGDGLADFTYRTSSGGPEIYYFPNGRAECAGSSELCWNTRVQMALDPFQSPPSPFGADPDVKTADVDFDKRIDVIRSEPVGGGVEYQVWFNRGGSDFTARQTIPQGDGEGFLLAAAGVQIVDWNGDRVPDVVRVRPSQIEVTVGLGYGVFAPKRIVLLPDVTLTDPEVARAKLEDVTGDGLVDLVLDRPVPNELWYWINLGNDSLALRRRVLDLPSQANATAEIRWGDMNGNGTTDLVYADAGNSPTLQTIDIGQIIGSDPSPHLLKRIGNGIGRVVNIEYDTTTQYLLADEMAGRPWPPLPFPVDVISAVAVDDSMGHRYLAEYTYHDGYYDAGEKEFRGFGEVEQRDLGDVPTCVTDPLGPAPSCSAPDLVTAYVFDTGRDAEALKGKTLGVEARAAEGGVFYREINAWQTRVLHVGANGDPRDVTFPFQEGRVRDVIERGSGPQVTLQWQFQYDDFGNQTRMVELGRDDPGPPEAPWNDERQTDTSYTAAFPSGQQRWILKCPVEQTTTDPDASAQVISRSRSFYDGSLVPGEVVRCNRTRQEQYVDATSPAVVALASFDQWGNEAGSFDPLYDAGNPSRGHYRETFFDPRFRAYPVEERIHTGNASAPVLSYSADHDAGLGLTTAQTNFNGHLTSLTYDPFARLTSITKPPDSGHTAEYDYVLAHDLGEGRVVNWVEIRQRDGSPGDGWLRSRTYSDGLGRTLMTRSEGSGAAPVIVTEAAEFNQRRSPSRKLLPYADGSLDYAAPSPTAPFSEHFYDALGREIRMNQALLDGQTRETAAFAVTQYAPLSQTQRDENQTDPASSHFGAASRVVHDGLLDDDGNGRLRQAWQIVRIDDAGEPTSQGSTPAEWRTTYEYDLLDNITRITDSVGNVVASTYDGLSRKTRLDDPNRGRVDYAYDAGSNLARTEDAKGQVIVYSYDGANRQLTQNYLDQSGDPQTDPVDVAYVYDVHPSLPDLGNLGASPPANGLGQLVSVFDLSGEEHTSFDQRARPVWVTKRILDPKSGALGTYLSQLSYDSIDRVTLITYPDNDVVRHEYDTRGLLNRIVGGPTGSIISGIDYDASGQALRTHYGNGVTTEYEYDQRLRLTTLRSAPAAGDPLLFYEYTLDRTSNVTRIDDRRPVTAGIPAAGPRRNTQSFAYDDLYRLLNVDYAYDVADSPASIAYRFDRIGNMRRQTSNIVPDPGDEPVNLGTMTYGEAVDLPGCEGRGTGVPAGPHALTSVGEGPARRFYSYDANGNMTCLDAMRLSWDFKDRLVGAETPTEFVDYVYDYADRRVAKLARGKSVSGTTPPPDSTLYIDQYFEVRKGEAIKYVFSGNQRVARVTASLDPLRERIQHVSLATGWNLLAIAVDAAQGLGADPAIDAAYRWEPPGYVAIDASTPLGASSVVWVHATAPTSLHIRGTYTEPLSATIGAEGSFVGVPGLTSLDVAGALPPDVARAWVYDATTGEWHGRFGGAESFLSTAPATLAPGEVLFVDTPQASLLSLSAPSEKVRFYHGDHLWSASIIADGDGRLFEEAAFFPYGNLRRRSAGGPVSSSVEPYMFTQKERDRETHLQNFGARYLAGHLGRFISADPVQLGGRERTLREPQRHNAYSYATNRPLVLIDPTGRDAEVKFENGTVTISAQIYIYGSGASQAQAATMQQNIMKDWNQGGKGWQYTDKTGVKYGVRFDVQVKLLDPNNPTKVPGFILDSLNPLSRKNYIEVGATEAEVETSFVRGGDEGKWRGYGPDPSSHEFGHLIGLDDRYNKGFDEKQKWAGNVMGAPAQKGTVEQRNIDSLMGPLVGRYEAAGSPAQYSTEVNESRPSW